MSTVEVCIPSADFSFLSLPPNKSEGQGHRIPPLLRKDGAPLDMWRTEEKDPKPGPPDRTIVQKKSLSSGCPLFSRLSPLFCPLFSCPLFSFFQRLGGAAIQLPYMYIDGYRRFSDPAAGPFGELPFLQRSEERLIPRTNVRTPN